MQIFTVSEVSGSPYCNCYVNSEQSRIQCLVYLLQIINSCDYIPCNGIKCQMMLLLPNQFNKRTDFWFILIAWLWLFPNLILQAFDIFNKRIICFVGIYLIYFFFLATILIITMFNWVRIKIGSWYNMLHISTFLHFLMRYLTDQNTFELCNYMLFS